MPRTIDKLRAFLPGGNPGGYFINPPAKMPGVSGVMLQRLAIDEDDLRRIVAEAVDETEVAAWIRAHTDATQYEAINGLLTHLKRKHVPDPQFYETMYAQTLSANPQLERLFDVIVADDARMFGQG